MLFNCMYVGIKCQANSVSLSSLAYIDEHYQFGACKSIEQISVSPRCVHETFDPQHSEALSSTIDLLK